MGNDPVVQSVEIGALQGMGFEELVREYRQWHEQEAEAKKKKEELGPAIEAMLMVARTKSLGVDHLVAVQANGSSASRVDTKLLVMKGVSADLIAECTIPGKKYTYVQVRDTTTEKE